MTLQVIFAVSRIPLGTATNCAFKFNDLSASSTLYVELANLILSTLVAAVSFLQKAKADHEIRLCFYTVSVNYSDIELTTLSTASRMPAGFLPPADAMNG